MTKLIRFSPAVDPRSMQREFDRLFDTFFPGTRREDDAQGTAVWSPRLDLVETADAYLISLDVPGMEKDDFAIDLHEGTLSVSGDRQPGELDEKDSVIRVERAYGRFYRSFTLPKAIDEKGIQASYVNGVLTIRAPKSEESKPRRIAVS